MEIKERIQLKARELFMRYGFRSVTMDEIASQLGISKKTVYQLFTDKDELVEAVMQAEMLHMQDVCQRQIKESVNAIEELFMDMDSLGEAIDAMNPQIIFDLEKFYPETHLKFKKHKHDFLLDAIRKNLERGIAEGLYRSDLDVDITAKFRLESFFIAFNQEMFPYGKYSLVRVCIEMYNLYVHAITTEKGKILIDIYKQQRKNKSLAA